MKFRDLITKIYSEITKVKVGDKVMLKKEHYGLEKGKVYTVISTYPINKINDYKQSIVLDKDFNKPYVYQQVYRRNNFKKVWF